MATQQAQDLDDEKEVFRRRVPRRNYECPVGVLLHGQFHLQRCYQIGEGGMMISSPKPLEAGTMVVVNFYVTPKLLIIVRGIARNVVAAKGAYPERYGIEFTHLGIQYKREIRNFVAAATRRDKDF